MLQTNCRRPSSLPSMHTGLQDTFAVALYIFILLAVCCTAGGGMSVSDNGLTEAQKYYVNVRPMEGRPKMAPVSKTAARGQKFAASSSLV
jgi:hypothetical protein